MKSKVRGRLIHLPDWGGAGWFWFLVIVSSLAGIICVEPFVRLLL